MPPPDAIAGEPPCRLELDHARWLRLVDEADAPELHALIDANRDHLARWMPWAAGQTHDDTVAFLCRARGQVEGNDGFQAAIVERGRISGMIGFHAVSWERRTTSIGYWLAASAQGRGTATEAVRALLGQAFVAWRLDRVEIRAAVENTRSRAIPERLGFVERGVEREAERIGDRYVDRVVYSILADEWLARRR